MAKEITDKTFSEETDKGLVLIDFWATWCGPWMQAPILEQLANEYEEDELKIVKWMWMKILKHQLHSGSCLFQLCC